MMKGDAGVDIAFTLLAGGLITKASSLCEPIKKMPGSYIVDVFMHVLINYGTLWEFCAYRTFKDLEKICKRTPMGCMS